MPILRTPADSYGFPSQLWLKHDLHGSVEGIQIAVQDDSSCLQLLLTLSLQNFVKLLNHRVISLDTPNLRKYYEYIFIELPFSR